MIIGSGLIARGFLAQESDLRDTCIYAAGVSNSSCNDPTEFVRDRERLQKAIACTPSSKLFVYFSTCSIEDPSLQNNRYISHKRELERLVRECERYLVIRLPQVAGITPNPHTVLNYLYARISRSERFDLWHSVTRNVIDIDDVTHIVLDLIFEVRAEHETINVASTGSSTIFEIVAAIERATDRGALYNIVDRGAAYSIDTSRIADSIQRCRIGFDENYLVRTIEKYYAKNAVFRR